MSFLQKLFRRNDDEKWVAENPGKRDFHMPPPGQAELDEAARVRTRIEQEMKDDGRRMEAQNRQAAAERSARESENTGD